MESNVENLSLIAHLRKFCGDQSSLKIRAALRVGAAPAPRRLAGSLNRTLAIRLASEEGEAKAGAFAYAPCEHLGAPNAAIRASDLVH